MILRLSFLGAGLLLALSAGADAAPVQAAAHYGALGRIAGPPIPNWDYATVDAPARRLYLAAQTAIVLDLDTGKVVANWPAGNGMVHTVTPVGGGGVAYDDGRANTVTFADVQTGHVDATVPTGAPPVANESHVFNPDAMILEPKTGFLVAVNSDSGTLVLIDPKRRAVVGTIKVGARMEFLAADGHGRLFVNLSEKNGIAEVDMKKRAVMRTLLFKKGCNGPSGLAYDAAHQLLISVCGNGVAEVISAADLKEVSSLAVAKGADGVMLDTVRQMAFIAGGDGPALSVIRIGGPSDVAVVQTIATEDGVRLGGVDPQTGKVYLPSVDFDHTAKRVQMSPDMPPMLPTLPKTFHFIVIGPK